MALVGQPVAPDEVIQGYAVDERDGVKRMAGLHNMPCLTGRSAIDGRRSHIGDDQLLSGMQAVPAVGNLVANGEVTWMYVISLGDE